MKKILTAAAVLVTAMTILAGCGKETAPATIEGIWRAGDGSTLTISDGMLTLTDSQGENLLAVDQLPCEHRGDFLYLDFGGSNTKVFEADLDGDQLTLRYTVEIQADMQTADDHSIQLTRSEG